MDENMDQNNSMKLRFSKYWAKGVSGRFSCWRQSDISQTDAQNMANIRASELEKIYRNSGDVPDKYLYSDRMLREPIVKEVFGSIISRNGYGSLILNSSNIMFVDIDFPKIGWFVSFLNLFKKSPIEPCSEILDKVRFWTISHPGWGWRVYSTAAGMRLIATHQLFDPESPQVHQVFEELGADPLYRVLCKVQKCFRARLTPKPWRCNFMAPPKKWPWKNSEDEYQFDNWLRLYESKSKDFSVCHLLAVIGSDFVHPDINPVLSVHDEYTRVALKMQLA
jgi:hypothetical protein